MYIFLFESKEMWERYIINGEPYPHSLKDHKRIYRAVKNWKISRDLANDGDASVRLLITGRKRLHVYMVLAESDDRSSYHVCELMDYYV